MEITKSQYVTYLKVLTRELSMVPVDTFDLWLNAAGIVNASEKVACTAWRKQVSSSVLPRLMWVRMFLDEIHDSGFVSWQDE